MAGLLESVGANQPGGGGDSGDLRSMVRQSRAEQEVIKSTVDDLEATVTKGAPSRFGNHGHALHFNEAHEVPALRRHVAAMDAALLERDVEIEQLKSKASKMENVLQHLRADVHSAGLWEERYEDAKRIAEAQTKMIHDAHAAKEGRIQQIRSLVQYVRILERSANICKGQVSRLDGTSQSRQENLILSDLRRKNLSDRVTELEDGFVRSVGRITNSLASGIITLRVGLKDAGDVRFAIFRKIGREGAMLEAFEEPDSLSEKHALRITKGESNVSVTAAKQIVVRSSPDSEPATIGCASTDELEKWLGAFYLVGALPAEAISTQPWPPV